MSSGAVSGGATGTIQNVENVIGTAAVDTVHYDPAPHHDVTVDTNGVLTVTDGVTTNVLTDIEILQVNGTTLDLTKSIELFDSGHHLVGRSITSKMRSMPSPRTT